MSVTRSIREWLSRIFARPVVTNVRVANCSFCGRTTTDAGPMVEARDNVFICENCINLCQSILAQEKLRRARVQELDVHGPG